MKNNRRRPNRPRRSPAVLDRINPNVAGIDCGSAEHDVAVPADRSPSPVQSFKTFTSELLRLADWLVACGVTSVAMEATGVYWIPIYDILEARGLEVLLVNARHIKHVPGRKSDVSDCEWLRDLHSVGLLRGSFRPTEGIVALRTYLRHRHSVVESAAIYIQRMQKALVQMNVQLPLVVSDITGVTGLKILRDIVAGHHDPEQLARHRDYRCRATPAEIVAALTGYYRPEHVFVLRQNLELFDACQRQLAACDRAIEGQIQDLTATRDIPAGTAGADLAAKGMLEKSEIVRRSVVPGAISNPDQVGELVTTQPIFAGEQISTRRFSTPSQRGIKAQLTGVQRAIEIDGGQHNLLAGTLKTGDKVDLVATFEAGGNRS